MLAAIIQLITTLLLSSSDMNVSTRARAEQALQSGNEIELQIVYDDLMD